MKWWKAYRRWKKSDNKGWAMAGRLLRMRNPDYDSFKFEWTLRYEQRLYRLTRDRENRVKIFGA